MATKKDMMAHCECGRDFPIALNKDGRPEGLKTDLYGAFIRPICPSCGSAQLSFYKPTKGPAVVPNPPNPEVPIERIIERENKVKRKKFPSKIKEGHRLKRLGKYRVGK